MTNLYRKLILSPALLLAVALGGCGKSGSKTVAQAPVPLGQGVVEGAVLLAGRPPAPRLLKKDARCGDKTMDIYDEAVVVSGKGALKNCLVYLKDAPPAGEGSTRKPVVMDQLNCQYTPRVVALQTGQTLQVINTDGIVHNVHTASTRNPAKNLVTPHADSKVELTFSKPEIFPVKCDVHPWMKGWIGVFDNPFFAVTDDQGRFEIKQIPPGTYTLVVHHERYGDLEQSITIPDSPTPVTADFTYKAPDEK